MTRKPNRRRIAELERDVLGEDPDLPERRPWLPRLAALDGLAFILGVVLALVVSPDGDLWAEGVLGWTAGLLLVASAAAPFVVGLFWVAVDLTLIVLGRR